MRSVCLRGQTGRNQRRAGREMTSTKSSEEVFGYAWKYNEANHESHEKGDQEKGTGLKIIINMMNSRKTKAIMSVVSLSHSDWCCSLKNQALNISKSWVWCNSFESSLLSRLESSDEAAMVWVTQCNTLPIPRSSMKSLRTRESNWLSMLKLLCF